jgi:hypothetical protein
MQKEIITYTKCANCFKEMPQKHDKWCNEECYDNLLNIYNSKYNSNKYAERKNQKLEL